MTKMVLGGMERASGERKFIVGNIRQMIYHIHLKNSFLKFTKYTISTPRVMAV